MSFLGLKSNSILTATAVLFFITLNVYSQNKEEVYDNLGIRENLGDKINTQYVEILPIISPDGKTLYFDRKYDKNNVGGEMDDDDIYYSELLPNGKWSECKNIGSPLNSVGSDVLFWISPDGNKALVHSGNVTGNKRVGFAIADKINGKWQTPKAINIDGLTDIGEVYYATMSSDAKQLIIAYSADTTKQNPRALDIYVCFSTSKDLLKWTKPKNVGSEINTKGFEGAPFLASDNRTLYFISDKEGGLGSADIYLSRRKGDSWTSWGKPINLGAPINTNGFEASLSIPSQRDYIYISSAGNASEDNYGSADIYRFKLPDSLKPIKSVIIKGSLTVNGKGAKGLIRVEENGNEVGSTSSDELGVFNFVLPSSKNYTFTGWAEGCDEKKVLKNVGNKDEIFVKISLNKKTSVQKSEKIEKVKEIKNIDKKCYVYFNTSSAELSKLSQKKLKNFTYNNGKIFVIGHTDSDGEEINNQELSKRRAENVKKYLIENGISDNNLSIEYFGEMEPISSNNTNKGKSLNRRVEVKIQE